MTVVSESYVALKRQHKAIQQEIVAGHWQEALLLEQSYFLMIEDQLANENSLQEQLTTLSTVLRFYSDLSHLCSKSACSSVSQ